MHYDHVVARLASFCRRKHLFDFSRLIFKLPDFVVPCQRVPMSLNALNKYRKIIRLIHRIPSGSQRQQALAKARQDMELGRLAQGAQAEALLEKMDDQIRYLKIITPKSQDEERIMVESTVFVVRDGKVVEGSGQRGPSRVADGKISMSEAYEKHHSLMRRQYFGREPPKYDPGSF